MGKRFSVRQISLEVTASSVFILFIYFFFFFKIFNLRLDSIFFSLDIKYITSPN